MAKEKNNLDDKLKDILNEFGNSIRDQASWMVLGGEYEPKSDPIAQIKQVFADEYGVLDLPKQELIADLREQGVLTGQEWYERFAMIFEAMVREDDPPEATYTLDDITYLDDFGARDILEAAKKAAGLNE